MLRHLRVHINATGWRAKLVEEYDIDDEHHKAAMAALIEDIKQAAVVRNYFIDRSAILEMYDKHMAYRGKINEDV